VTVRPRTRRRAWRYRRTIRAPLSFVYRWCTDYREDDDRLTDDLYQYRAEILLREPRRVVRVIRAPVPRSRDDVELEIIELQPPDHWKAVMVSLAQDRRGVYRLRRLDRGRTAIEIRFTERWKSTPSDRGEYGALFDRVWDRYVARIESEYQAARSGSGRNSPSLRGGRT
jgi:hypothetical protein